MQIVSPPPETPEASTTHRKSRHRSRRAPAGRGAARHLLLTQLFCTALEPPLLLWSERAGEGAVDSTGRSTANGSCWEARFRLGKLREDRHRQARGKPVCSLAPARARQVHVRTQVLPVGGTQTAFSRALWEAGAGPGAASGGRHSWASVGALALLRAVFGTLRIFLGEENYTLSFSLGSNLSPPPWSMRPSPLPLSQAPSATPPSQAPVPRSRMFSLDLHLPGSVIIQVCLKCQPL